MNTIEKALLKKKQNNESSTTKSDSKNIDPPSSHDVGEESSASIDNIEKSDTTHATVSSNQNQQYIELDLTQLEKNGFVSTNAQRLQINEEYRAIKRKLLANAFGPLSESLSNSNIIMVTSSRPGEGKTFTAVNLALSIALEQDKTVLLVDADVLRPSIMNTLAHENRQGLIEYLLGEKSDISEVMCSTNIPKLRIIPAGKYHHLSTELLASGKMFEAVEEFANRYTDRVVIVDTPPLLGINETAILANLAGQALVVTEEGKSKLGDIQKAVSQLNPEMAIGFVVNKAQGTSEDDSGYGYYYAGSD